MIPLQIFNSLAHPYAELQVSGGHCPQESQISSVDGLIYPMKWCGYLSLKVALAAPQATFKS